MAKRISDLKKLKLSGKRTDDGGKKENKTGVFSFLNNALHFIIYDDDIVISKGAEAEDSEEYEEDENEKVKTFKELNTRGEQYPCGGNNNTIQFFKAKLSEDEYIHDSLFTLNSGFRTKKKLILKNEDGNLYKRYTYRITKKLKLFENKYPVEEVFDKIKSQKQTGSLEIKKNNFRDEDKNKEEINNPDAESDRKLIDLSSSETTEFKLARETRKINYSFGVTTPSAGMSPPAEIRSPPGTEETSDEDSDDGENTTLSKKIIQKIKKARDKILPSDGLVPPAESIAAEPYVNEFNEDAQYDDEEDEYEGETEYEDENEKKFGYLFSSFQNKKKLIAGLQRVFIVFFAIIAGSASMPFGINPLGLALICASDRYIFYIYAGLALSLIPQTEYTAMFLILYSAAAVIKYFLKYKKQKAKTQMLASSISFRTLEKEEKQKILNMFRFNDSNSTIISLLLNAIASCLLGIARLLISKSFVYSEIIQIMLFILVGMLFTYLYSGLFEVCANNKALEKAGISAVIFTVVYKLAPLYFMTLSIGYIASFLITLCAANSTVRIKESRIGDGDDTDFENDDFKIYDSEIARRFTINVLSNDGTMSNMTKGAMVGIICGIALGDTAAAVTLAVCGLISGLFFNQSAVLAIIAGMISAVSYSIYIAGIDALQYYIINMAVAMTFFIPLNKIYSAFINGESANNIKKLSPQREKGILLTELPVKRLDTLSDAFSNLSSTFDELADKLKYPSKGELTSIIESAFEPNCAECVNFNVCNIKVHSNMKKIKGAIADILTRKGRLDISEGTVPTNLLLFLKCEMRGEIVKTINTLYRKRTEENINNDKTALFASNFKVISELLGNSRNVGKEDIFFQQNMSEKIYLRLGNMGIECENVIVLGKRRYKVYIFGVKMSDYAGTIEEICAMFENICGTSFAEPEYIIKENFITMKVQSREKYKIYTMQASRSASESAGAEAVNGDSFSYFEGDDGLYYSVISDGMGSGRQAAVASRLTILMLEKLLAAGNVKDLTLEMINNLLLSKNDECFATVDLFEADLITGNATFIKAGAAPSFLIRSGRIFKIQSSTVPAGILPHMNAEKTKFQLEHGDYIIMFTDGIVSTFEESSWLLSMLSEIDNRKDFKKFMGDILNEARDKNPRIDDMSIQITRILEV